MGCCFLDIQRWWYCAQPEGLCRSARGIDTWESPPAQPDAAAVCVGWFQPRLCQDSVPAQDMDMHWSEAPASPSQARSHDCLTLHPQLCACAGASTAGPPPSASAGRQLPAPAQPCHPPTLEKTYRTLDAHLPSRMQPPSALAEYSTEPIWTATAPTSASRGPSDALCCWCCCCWLSICRVGTFFSLLSCGMGGGRGLSAAHTAAAGGGAGPQPAASRHHAHCGQNGWTSLQMWLQAGAAGQPCLHATVQQLLPALCF